MNSVLDDIIDKSGILGETSTFEMERSILAFVSWSNEFVELCYPTVGSGWVKRSDCGSHSQHRWALYDKDFYEIVQLVVKHSSCLKAMFMQPLCKNCEMRHVWRQPCMTPSNIFFVLALDDIETCQSYLEPFIISRKTLSLNNIDIYKRYTPKPVYHAKVVKSTPKKRKQLDKLEKDIESSVVALNRNMKMSRSHAISTEREFKRLEQQKAQLLEQQQQAQTSEQQEVLSAEQREEMNNLEIQRSYDNYDSKEQEEAIPNTNMIKPAFIFAYLPVLPSPQLPTLEETTDTTLA